MMSGGCPTQGCNDTANIRCCCLMCRAIVPALFALLVHAGLLQKTERMLLHTSLQPYTQLTKAS